MDFYWIGAIISRIAAILPFGGGGQKNVLIEELRAQAQRNADMSQQHLTLASNHITHLQAALEIQTPILRGIDDSLKINTSALGEIRNTLIVLTERVNHIRR